MYRKMRHTSRLFKLEKNSTRQGAELNSKPVQQNGQPVELYSWQSIHIIYRYSTDYYKYLQFKLVFGKRTLQINTKIYIK